MIGTALLLRQTHALSFAAALLAWSVRSLWLDRSMPLFLASAADDVVDGIDRDERALVRLDARILASVDSSALASCLTSVPQAPPQPFMNIRSASCRHTAAACRPLDSLRELVHHGLGIRSSSSTMRLMPEPSIYLKLFCYFC